MHYLSQVSDWSEVICSKTGTFLVVRWDHGRKEGSSCLEGLEKFLHE